MKKFLALAAALLLAMMAVGCSKTMERQILEQLELGQKYLSELNYEEAIVAFQKVIELEPKTWEAYAGISEVYEAQDDYDGAVSILESGLQQVAITEIPSADIDRLVGLYKACAHQAEEQGDKDRAWELYDKILALRPDDAEAKEKLEERQREEEERKQGEATKAALSKFVEPIVEVMQTAAQEHTYDFNATPLADDEFRALVSELNAPAIFPLQDGRYLCIEPGLYIYYGQMTDGIREGDGIWAWLDEHTSDYVYDAYFDIVVANWNNNLPNGSAEMYSIASPEGVGQGHREMLQSWVLSLADGVYDGECESTSEFQDGTINHSFDVYVDGYLTESTYIMTDPDGNTYEGTETDDLGDTHRHKIPGLGIQ